MSKNLRGKNVPELRFPDFKEDSRKTTLAKIANFSSGGTPSKANPEYWNGDIPWISASSMYEDILVDSENKITELGLNNGSRLAAKNSILILVRGSILYKRIPIGITGRKVAFNQDIKALEINKNVNQSYLFYWLKFKEHFIKSIVTGTGIGAGKIDTSQLKLLNILLPKVEEQEKLASFLGAVDARLTQLRRKQKLLQTYKKGVMQKIFSQQIRFKQDDGKPFPDWEKKKLGDLGEVISGLTYSPSDIRKEGLLVLRSSNIYNGKILLNDCVFVNTVVNSENITKQNDILICVRNGSTNLIGKNALIPPNLPISTHGAFMVVFRGIANNFIFHLFQTDIYKRQVYQDLGARINSINSNRLRKYKFLIPKDKREQEKIANLLTSIDKKIEAVALQIEAMEKFKKGLLKKMFV